MVGKLERFSKNPNRKPKRGQSAGAGIFYKRTVKKGRKKIVYYSEYQGDRDSAKKAKTRVKNGNVRYAHTHDGTYHKAKKGKDKRYMSGKAKKFSKNRRV